MATLADPPVAARTPVSAPASASGAAPTHPRAHPPTDDGTAPAAFACLALAALSVLLLPSLPSYDPFSWLTWGHELSQRILGHPTPLILQGGPSWKPLPVLFTTLFGFFGWHETVLWIVFSRWIGLFGVFVAYRLAARLGSSERARWAGPLAGMLAAAAICLTLQWFNFMFRATSEPLTITATLLWADHHVRGHRMRAFAAAVVLSLMRPEAAILLGIYALWCVWTLPGIWRRLVVCAGVVLIPAAWIAPPWLIAGKPLQSSAHARDFKGNRGDDLATIALQRTEHLCVGWAPFAAVILIALALIHREWIILTLAGFCIAYLGIVEVMTVAGFPGLPRFMLPAAAIVCVLAGVGVVRLAQAIGTLAGPGLGCAWLSAVAAAALVAMLVPLSERSVGSAHMAESRAAVAVRSYDALRSAVARAGGRRRVLRCSASFAAVNHTAQTSLAWILDVPDTRVLTVTYHDRSLDHTALAFFAPRNPVLGGSPTRLLGTLRGRRLFRERMWSVVRVTRLGHPRVNRCVGV